MWTCGREQHETLMTDLSFTSLNRFKFVTYNERRPPYYQRDTIYILVTSELLANYVHISTDRSRRFTYAICGNPDLIVSITPWEYVA